MESYNEQQAYERARKKVKEIRGFYINLFVYCFTIPIIIYINLTYSPHFHWFWFSVIGWGSATLFHGLSIFGAIPFLGHDWEDRKLREFMDKENETK